MNDLSKDDSEMWHPQYYPKKDDLTKEEIIEKSYSNRKSHEYYNGWIENAMQEYADQQAKKEAVGFMEWKEDEGYECVMYDDVKMWQKKGSKLYSSEELYDIYNQLKEK